MSRQCIIFSQFTSMLDLCAEAFEQASIATLRLDGRMSQQQRAVVLETFRTDPNTRVFLLSLRAGGVGLNLTSASVVFLLVVRACAWFFKLN
jgi:SNF2 family DNA or RNA helicase